MASCSTAEVSCAPRCSHRVSLCGGVVYKWWFLAQFPFPPSKSKKNAQKYFILIIRHFFFYLRGGGKGW